MKIFIRKVLQITRSLEWWEYKLPPILSAGYLILYNSGLAFTAYAGLLLIVLLSLVAGAAYVSILNDVTDLQEDFAAGKLNRMARFTIIQQKLLVGGSLLAGVSFILYYSQNLVSSLCYLFCYISFTLYSLPPFRFKEKGVAGIFADALGSQLFPTLLITTFISFKAKYPVHSVLLISIGIWSLCFGLRGILWHQFKDAQHDKISGLQTVVHTVTERKRYILERIIISTELIAFTTLLLFLNFTALIIAFILYFCYVYLFCRQSAIPITIITFLKPSYILMNEFYQVFLPITILICAGFDQVSTFVILLVHVLLFPTNLLRALKRIYSLRYIFTQGLRS